MPPPSARREAAKLSAFLAIAVTAGACAAAPATSEQPVAGYQDQMRLCIDGSRQKRRPTHSMGVVSSSRHDACALVDN
eukprot:2748878-Pleurochrysis_carterae.AAC.1